MAVQFSIFQIQLVWSDSTVRVKRQCLTTILRKIQISNTSFALRKHDTLQYAWHMVFQPIQLSLIIHAKISYLNVCNIIRSVLFYLIQPPIMSSIKYTPF